MDIARFEELVEKAVSNLPQEFRERLDNIEVLVAELPTSAQMQKTGITTGNTLLGLYEGVPRTKRGSHYGMVLPDKITVFRRPIVTKCRTEEEIIGEIERVVQHEIAHHFGISDERLEELGK